MKTLNVLDWSIKSCAQESGLMFGAVVVYYGVDDDNFRPLTIKTVQTVNYVTSDLRNLGLSAGSTSVRNSNNTTIMQCGYCVVVFQVFFS